MRCPSLCLSGDNFRFWRRREIQNVVHPIWQMPPAGTAIMLSPPTPQSHGRDGGDSNSYFRASPPLARLSSLSGWDQPRPKKRQDGKAVFLSPACLNSAGNGSSFFYFSNGGDVVVRSVPLSLDGVNYTEPRQMVSITQGRRRDLWAARGGIPKNLLLLPLADQCVQRRRCC